jgi:hypothetical protein
MKTRTNEAGFFFEIEVRDSSPNVVRRALAEKSQPEIARGQQIYRW